MEKPETDKAPRKARPGITFRSTGRPSRDAGADADDRIFMAVRLPASLITRVKTAAVQERRKLQDVAEEAFTEWLANRR
jgi:hypothetical protein